MTRKPRMFIGSSVEGLSVGDAINLNLDHEIEVTLWRTGAFDLASTALDSLVKRSTAVDFALFVFSPDDLVTIRSQQHVVVRDNVLFELGLFIGALGKDRCFIVKPRNVELHLPTDLLGVTPADYEAERSDEDIAAAVNHACVLVKRKIAQMGLLRAEDSAPQMRPISPQHKFPVKKSDYYLLTKLASTITRYRGGTLLHSIENNRRGQVPHNLDISAIRLERGGYIERKIEVDENDNEYYAYFITDQGVEELLRLDEDMSAESATEVSVGVAGFADDEIPF